MDPAPPPDPTQPPAGSAATPVVEVRPIATSPARATALTPQQIEQLQELTRLLVHVAGSPAVHEVVGSLVDQVRGFVARLKPALAALGSVTIFVGEMMLRIPPELRTSVLALANRGWFFDPNLALPSWWRAKELIESGKADEADALMAAHFERRLDAIEAELVAALPHRVSKFKSGFAAHRRGEYDLSILAFMSQADGVCAELRGGHFFLTDRATRLPEAAAYAAGMTENFVDELAHLALVERLPIRERMKRRQANGATGLNRHAVMHGESLDHDTKENSLRTLSLLNYVALGLDLDEGSALKVAAKAPLASIANIAAQSSARGQGGPAAP